MEQPVYVIFITDGDNGDHNETEKVIKTMSEEGFFVQFVGIGRERFTFLQKLDDLQGRKIDNVNFFQVKDIKAMSDEDLYNNLMNEFPGWVKEARKQNMIV